MKILVSADLHLGKQSSNVSRTLSESSVKFTWDRMIRLAVENSLDALLLAGDIVDRDNRFFEAIGPLQKGLETLGEAGIPVVMVSGNHDFDVLPDIIKSRSFDHVHLLGEKGVWEAKTIETRSGKLQVLGWSFPKQHIMEDPLLQLSVQNLDLDPNLPTAGLLHGDLYDRKSHYAPTNVTGFPTGVPHVWVIGHIHKPDTVRTHDPLILYPGSPQALSAKEPGIHGVSLISFDGGTVQSEQIPLSPVRYEPLHMDIAGIEYQTDFRNRVLEQMRKYVLENVILFENVSHLVFDIVLTGHHTNVTDLDKWSQFADELEQQMEAETMVSVRKIVNLAEPVVANLEELAKQPTPPGMIAKLILDLESGNSSDFSEELIVDLKNQISSANRSGTYQPLSRFDEQIPDSDESARDLLLQETRQLLGELLSQKETA